MPTAAVRIVASALTVLALAGCSALDGIRREPPPPPPAAEPAPVSDPIPAPFQIRSAAAPVPAGYRQATVEFADARHGAALFTRCRLPKRLVGNHNDCSAVLLVTADGGTSWQARKHPQPVADGQQLYVGTAGTIVLLAEPAAYYVSGDGGVTFRKYPYRDLPPVPYRALSGPYEICCDADPAPTLRHLDGQSSTPVPVQPPLPGFLAAVAVAPHPALWTASIDRGRVSTAASRDDGRTWGPVDVPNPGTGLGSVRFATAGSDLWLVGDTDRRTFPALWFFGAAGWKRLSVRNAPAAYLSTAALGGGLLAVSGPAGTGVVNADGAFIPTDWPAHGWLRPLSGGGLQLSDDMTGTLWLGEGAGAEWRWTQLILRPTGR